MGALLSLAALFLPALMPLVLKREDVLRAVQHIAAVEPQSQPLRQQLDELRQQATLGEELRQGLQQSLPLASVVDALSQALPDDTWLDRIDVNGNEIRISGLTGNAAELAALLGRQPQFADTKATVASVRDNNLNKERFTFEMRWRAVEGVKP
ncbi:MAG TPA: PilN domain-containing protein [Giesbergeria sp.]|nr:PilN domain-containing protein [Giesbergeria sp.]